MKASQAITEVVGSPADRGSQSARSENALRSAVVVAVKLYDTVDLVEILRDPEVVVMEGHDGSVAISSRGTDYYIVEPRMSSMVLSYCGQAGVDTVSGKIQPPTALV